MINWRQVGLVAAGVVAVALLVADWSLVAATAGPGRSYPYGLGSALGDAFAALGYLVGAAVGALIVLRRPGNRIGWMLLVAGVATLFGEFASEYAGYGLAWDPGSLPAARVVGWLGAWVWRVGVALIAGGVLLAFPDGHLPSPRWRPVAVLTGLVLTVYVVGHALAPGPMTREFAIVDNPVGLHLPGLHAAPHRGWIVVLGVVVVAAVALATRARRGPSVERQQIKWLAYAALLAVAGLPLWDAQLAGWRVEGWWAEVGRLWTLLVVPAFIGIAVLRHNLYNIDLVIRRTATYTVVTALLAGAYAVLVVVLQRPLAPVADGSELVVAASTLIVAAAFGPVRGRVQHLVDRHFNRERYDAERAVEDFGHRLRGQVELASMSRELCGVVEATIQPASVSLWTTGGRGTAGGSTAS